MWRSQAEAEGLTLLEADNKTGYFGVYLKQPGTAKPYQAEVRRGGKMVSLGYFATAEEAALCVARSPEGQAAAAVTRKEAAPMVQEAREPRDVVIEEVALETIYQAAAAAAVELCAEVAAEVMGGITLGL